MGKWKCHGIELSGWEIQLQVHKLDFVRADESSVRRPQQTYLFAQFVKFIKK